MAHLDDVRNGRDFAPGRRANAGRLLGAVVHRGETAERAYALFRDLSLKQAA